MNCPYGVRSKKLEFLRYALPVLRSLAKRDEGWMRYALCDLKKEEGKYENS
jgi:hypothetical protein